jgi:DNA invertase Pin-like site-specific DNA recombinase
VQLEQIVAYCNAHGLGVPIEYQDASTSGATEVHLREAGACLMRDLARGDHLVVSKWDRLFRSLRDAVCVLAEFRNRGVVVHICNFYGQAINLSTPIGRFIAHLFALFAEMERDLLAERTGDSIRSLKRRGYAAGRPHYGFKHKTVHQEGRKRRLEVPDPEEREQMAMMAELRRKRWPIQQIFEHVTYELKIVRPNGKCWNQSSIRQAIKAELLLQYGDLKRCDAHSN